jgi:hypothetical protein
MLYFYLEFEFIMANPFKSAFNIGIAQFLRWRYKRIEYIQNQPIAAQNQVWQKLVYSMRSTWYGRQFNFSEIRTYQDFAARVPSTDYENIKPYIQRMMHGERDLLVNGIVKWYSKSSGTTSDKSKFIPIPRENLYGCHIRGSWDTVTILYHHNPEIRLFAGKSLIMGGSIQPVADSSIKSRTGDISAIMIHHMPSVGRPFYAPDTSIALVADWETKIRLTAEYLQKEKDLVMLGGVPTWNLVLFRKILQVTGANHLQELFPGLKAYVHGGVGFDPYREEFKKLLPSEDFIYLEVYNASEGYFAASDMPNSKDMLLLLDNGIFYEFLELGDFESRDDSKIVPLEGVKPNVHYVMLISSSSGLWRYIPGDTVMFTSLKPYRIRITGRTQQFVNAFGEEVVVANTDQALALTCQEFGAIALEYTVAPVYLSTRHQGRHEWLIEFEQSPSNLLAFAKRLDENLQMLNSDYEAKRSKSLALDCLSLTSLKKDTFLHWLKSKGKLGGQNKVPRLSNNRKIVEEVLHFIENHQA